MDRYNHEVEAEDTEDDMDDPLFHSFSSFSPRYSRMQLRSEDKTTVSASSLHHILSLKLIKSLDR